MANGSLAAPSHFLLRHLHKFILGLALVQTLGDLDTYLVEDASVVEDGEGIGVVGEDVGRALVLYGLPERRCEAVSVAPA
jgi:hypothetical protein